MSELENLEKALAEWMGEVQMMSKESHSDGTPLMGKFETEEVYRKAQAYFVAKKLGETNVKTPEGFRWIGRPAQVRGEDFVYEATVLCSFPKSNGKVRYIVEDHGRIFIQRESQITFMEVGDSPPFQVAGELPGCPHCGYRHPPDGMCV